MGFFKTLFTGYKIMFQELNLKHNDLIPRCFSGCGTGLMMIGSAVMAKTAMKEDVQKVIAECDAAIEEAKKSVAGEKPIQQKKRVFKAKVMKGLKMVKTFRAGIALEAIGGASVGVGFRMEEKGKHRATKALGALGTAFMGYRAAVREDLGEEADIRYMSGKSAVKKTGKIDKKTGEVTYELEQVTSDDGLEVPKNPDSFRFWFSEETCPSLWNANYDLRVKNLEWVENGLTLRYWASDSPTTLGHISLNDMRREFGGLQPAKMDVDEGGIFGLVLDPNRPKNEQRVDLGFRHDQDFMEGRTTGCWIIFPCDEKPIIGRIRKKKNFTPVEK